MTVTEYSAGAINSRDAALAEAVTGLLPARPLLFSVLGGEREFRMHEIVGRWQDNNSAVLVKYLIFYKYSCKLLSVQETTNSSKASSEEQAKLETEENIVKNIETV